MSLIGGIKNKNYSYQLIKKNQCIHNAIETMLMIGFS